jgi:hypothetical protein
MMTALEASYARADVIEATSSRDTTIFQNNPNNSLGGAVTIYAGTNSNNSPRRSLIAFDLSAIPAGSTINSVRLDLVLADVSGGESVPTRTLGLHTLVGDWGEGTKGWLLGPGGTGQGYAADEGDATWTYQFFDTDPWTNLGGDFVGTASATASVGDVVGATYSWSSTGMIADVQGWVDDPGSNFGWLLMGDESASGTFRTFWTREADLVGRAADHPRLVVDYAPVPEPSSLVLFAAGAVGVFVTRLVRKRPGVSR